MIFFLDWHSSGKVNDLAFPHRNRQLCIITCGEDKTVKVYFTWHILCIITTLDCFCENSFLCRCGVWNAVTGNKLYTFEGHKAPVYSVCPDNKENMQVFSCFICTFASWQFFFNISWETSKACFSCLSQSFRLKILFSAFILQFGYACRGLMHLSEQGLSKSVKRW